MNNLTTPINVRNIQKMHVAAVQIDGDNLVATVTVITQGGGGVVYRTDVLQVRDGNAQGIRATVSPLGYLDCVEVFTTNAATAFSDLVTAYTGGVAARNRAVETALIAAGLMPPGVVS